MRRWWPRVLNLLLWLIFCFLAGTGLLLAFRLPPGSRGGRGLEALGMGRHDWGDLHTWASYGFLALILAHLAMHWRWLWQVAARRRAWPLLAGVAAGVVMILGLALQPVSRRVLRSGRGGAPVVEEKEKAEAKEPVNSSVAFR